MNTIKKLKKLKKYGSGNENKKRTSSNRSSSDISEADTEIGISDITYRQKVKAKSLPLILEQKQKTLIKARKVKSEIFQKKNIKLSLINKKNYNFKPSYISAVKTGSDFSFSYIFDILHEEIINNINDIDINKTKVENYADGLLKTCFMFLDKVKQNSKYKKGGNCSFTAAHSLQEKYLKYQYVFDNKHDFKKESETIPDDWYYNETDITENDLKPYFKIPQQLLFKELLKKSDKIVDNILFFSVYNLVEYKKNNPDIVGRVIINNEAQLKMIKEELAKFIQDILVSSNLKFVYDGNLNVGEERAISDYYTKLKQSGILDSAKINTLLSQSQQWRDIKNQIKALVGDNRFYILEDIFDSYPINTDLVITKLNDTFTTNPSEINKYAYITNLIYNNIDFRNTPHCSNLHLFTESFKAYTQLLREMFKNVYYSESGSPQRIGTAIIFNDNTDIFTTNSKLNSSLHMLELIYLKPPLSATDYIYSKETSKTSTNFYAIDIAFLRGKYVGVDSFNTISNIVNMIKLLKETNNIDTLINRLTSNLSSPSSTKNYSIIYNIFLLIYISNFIYNKNNLTPTSSIMTPAIKKDIAQCLFNLKRAGDMGKILFAFYYNSLKNTQTFNSTVDLCYTGNDKLAVLNSIIRQGNSVLFPDATNHAFSIYNINDKNFTFLSFMGLLNMYLIPKFIDNDYNIFDSIYATTVDERLRPPLDNMYDINYIFKTINHESIFIKKDGNLATSYELLNTILSNLQKSLLDEIPQITTFTDVENFKRQSLQLIYDYRLLYGETFPSNLGLEMSEILQLKASIEGISNTSNLLDTVYALRVYTNLQKYDHFFRTNNNVDRINNLISEINNPQIQQNEKEKNTLILYICKMMHYFSLIYHTKKIIDTSDVNVLINFYFKYIIIAYLRHIKFNIEKNLTNEVVIKFYLNNVIFYRLDLENITPIGIKEYYTLLTTKILDIIRLNICAIIDTIIKIIEKNINPVTDTNNILNVDIIRNLFININKFLKIIDVFLYVDINEQGEILENDNNIYFCMKNLKYHIYDLMNIKAIGIDTTRQTPKRERFKLSYARLERDLDNTLLSSIITPLQTTEFQDNTIGIKCKSLTLSLFNNLDILNYVILFNSLYEELNKYKEIKIFDKLLYQECREFEKLIKQIKKIYKYTYAEAHSDVIKNKSFEKFINHITELLRIKADITIESYKKNVLPSVQQTEGRKRTFTNPITPEKIDFFEKTIDGVINEITNNIKPHFLSMEQYIHDDIISAKYSDLDDIRYILPYDMSSEETDITPKNQLTNYVLQINDINDDEIEKFINPVLAKLRQHPFGLNQQDIDSLLSNTNDSIIKLAKNYDYFIND